MSGGAARRLPPGAGRHGRRAAGAHRPAVPRHGHRPDPRRAAGHRGVRPWSDLVVHDTDAGRAEAFAARHTGRTAASAQEVAAAADTVLLATWAREPLLRLSDTRDGHHFTSLGADEPGRQELSADLLRAAILVVDDRELAESTGALAAAGLPATAADAEPADVLRGERPGRVNAASRSV
ncbi:hypothetical protein [Streptomyces sp. bgisy034]|uniref:hypothetical protein n=1 Tax=Streptomyces sp. bgisy034 TaxID=3413774 RepID=UPI003EBA4E7D